MNHKRCDMIFIRKIRREKAFTLLEIMIAMSIFLIVSAMAFALFSGALNYWKKGYDTARTHQAARLVFGRMTDNISSLFLSSANKDIYCEGSASAFYFITTLSGQSDSSLSEAGYEFNSDDKSLVYAYQENADYSFSTFDSRKVIATGVLNLKFSYLNNKDEWRDTWEAKKGGAQEGTIPRAIKITFEVESEYLANKKEIFDTVVTLPMSIR